MTARTTSSFSFADVMKWVHANARTARKPYRNWRVFQKLKACPKAIGNRRFAAGKPIGSWENAANVLTHQGRFFSQLGKKPCEINLLMWTYAPQQKSYSITSSASNCIELGTARPSAFAVLKLMTNSNLVDCCTGRSAGFSPLTIRPV